MGTLAQEINQVSEQFVNAIHAAEIDAESNGGEVSEYIWAALEQTGADRERLIIEGARVIKSLDSEIEMLESKVNSFCDMIKKRANSIAAIRKGITSALREGEKIRAADVGTVYNMTTYSAEVIADVPHVLDGFVRYSVKEEWNPDKKAITAAFKAGKPIPEWAKVNTNVTAVVKA